MLPVVVTEAAHAGRSRTCLWGSWNIVQGYIVSLRNDSDPIACSLKVIQHSHSQPILPAPQKALKERRDWQCCNDKL